MRVGWGVGGGHVGVLEVEKRRWRENRGVGRGGEGGQGRDIFGGNEDSVKRTSLRFTSPFI